MRQVSDTGYCFMNHRAHKHTLSDVDCIQQFTSTPNKFQPFGLFCVAPVSVQPSLVLTERCHRTLICAGIWVSLMSVIDGTQEWWKDEARLRPWALGSGISHYRSPWTLQTVVAAEDGKSQRDAGRCGRDLTPAPAVLQPPLLPFLPNLLDTRPYILHDGGKSSENTYEDLDKWRTDRFSLCIWPNPAPGKLL